MAYDDGYEGGYGAGTNPADGRATRTAVEVLTQATTTDVRATRVAVEAITQATSTDARATRVAVEVIVQDLPGGDDTVTGYYSAMIGA